MFCQIMSTSLADLGLNHLADLGRNSVVPLANLESPTNFYQDSLADTGPKSTAPLAEIIWRLWRIVGEIGLRLWLMLAQTILRF